MLKVYKKYYQFLFRYKWQFILFAIFLVGLSITESIHPYFYKLFIEKLPENNFQVLLNILFLYSGVRLLELVFDILTYILGDSVLLPSARDARMAVFKKIQDLDFAFSLTRSTGSMISSMKRGDGAFFSLFHAVNIKLVRIVLNFVVVMFFFFQIKIEIALLMFVSMFINMIFAYFMIKKNIFARKKFNEEEDKISNVIVDNMINFETVKLFAKEDQEYEKLGTKFVPWMNRLWGYANSFRKIDIVVGTLGELSLFLVLFAGLRQVTDFNLSAAEYVMIIGFVSSFYPRFFELIFELRNIAKHNVDLEKYFDVFNFETLVKDKENPVIKESIKGEVVFDDVCFSYPEGRQDALKNMNLRIREGQSVAFVGASGAGKTTITKLLMRFFDPDSGKITIDGTNIADLTKVNLRSFMGVVPQEPILFNDSIAYNIGYGAGTSELKEVVSAAKMANLHEFIDDLAEGYDTKVGERGVRLSGGQKQRLAIARMILSNPDIIIFDEATSQLDSASEKLIQDAFWKASKNKTTLIIAHRLSSITRADKIIVMDDGQIAEIGTHKELLRKDGLYSKFWKLQTEV
ncbi:MAG: ABC transporter ATP-binding protein [Candidatus Pacebacteria bacterium]|jgi:ATP-binding cassette, subfamily B, heavy metal transporter|nr:ABC transporter ATP-binding protein [Candidatus Paceibacterota bacterium]MBT6755882.1 ABC transporter ATP-binding protein [Candidatus Paceibacterota bacterium]MBT6921095.1 ABC transporter ATP-binding protein [Candidatus Paceibacterota bacterium]